jgi:hypothetical protein
MSSITKVCKCCKETKNILEFYKSGSYYKSYCKVCQNSYDKNYYINNKDKRCKYFIKYRENKRLW